MRSRFHSPTDDILQGFSDFFGRHFTGIFVQWPFRQHLRSQIPFHQPVDILQGIFRFFGRHFHWNFVQRPFVNNWGFRFHSPTDGNFCGLGSISLPSTSVIASI
ncbi:hypothetical protein AVEN_40867-1 [Araneus ventricosus]|uniref:Uncharacterized protein n=1 Tax=Araneus ventricosus TaxID=182803 RepID=A0A4Y2QQY8_ARAVE|nr:hypothetical protein AVEN_40867-1 [Araneus ventricosus]